MTDSHHTFERHDGQSFVPAHFPNYSRGLAMASDPKMAKTFFKVVKRIAKPRPMKRRKTKIT